MRAKSKNIRKTGKRPSDDDVLLKLWPKYQAATARAAQFNAPVAASMTATELRAWDRAGERANSRLVSLQNAVYALRPRTAAGLRVKAQVLADEGAENKLDKAADAYERGLCSLALDAVAILNAPIKVSAAVVAAIAVHEKAQARVETFCARKVARIGDEKRLAKLCDADIAAGWAMLDLEPISVADLALILRRLDAFSDAGHILPERATRKGDPGFETGGSRTFQDDLIKVVAGWLARLGGVSA